MTDRIKIDVSSEIGELEGVILHVPGSEVENMTPENAERALYSDVLNLQVALNEYNQLHEVLKKVSNVYIVKDLLKDILKNEKIKQDLVHKICENENCCDLIGRLTSLNAGQLADQLLEGVVKKDVSLTKFMSNERYDLMPLHNFFFTRDASMTVYDKVFIGRMRSKVRERESFIMESIFNYSPSIDANTVNPQKYSDFDPKVYMEGGDVQIASEDVLVIGMGPRTSSQGIDFIIERFKKRGGTKHILVQQLPHTPESFIHLDMVFTFLDKDQCMVYEPVILGNNKLQTVHIVLDNGKVKSINTIEGLLPGLKKLGFDLKPVLCGGKDPWMQQREQWHSGANFFAMAPGKIIGYERNSNTIEALNQSGFEVIKAEDVIKGTKNLDDYSKYVVTIKGSELARGGGGCRCMTMPIRRKKIEW